MGINLDFQLDENHYAALECLASRGGSLPGSIVQRLIFESPTACQKAMNHLERIGLVQKGKYKCHWPELSSSLFYVLTTQGLGLTTAGENLNTLWLSNIKSIWFNLICAEARLQAEIAGYRWISNELEILKELQANKIVWHRLEDHWPVFGISKEGKLSLVWIFWEGLTIPQIGEWERVTREIRQKDLLLGIALSQKVAKAIKQRLINQGIRCAVGSLEENFAASLKY